MRITNNFITQNFLRDVQRIQVELEKARTQAATGKLFSRPGESPQNAVKSLQTSAELFTNSQFQRNNDFLLSNFQNIEGSLGGVGDILQRVRELMVQGANDTLVQKDRDAIAKEVDQLLRQLVDHSNTNVGGEYIFGGSDTKSPPVTLRYGGDAGEMKNVTTYFPKETRTNINLGNPTAFVYSGDDIKYKTEMAKNTTLDRNIPGSEIFFTGYPVSSGPQLVEKTNPHISESTLLTSLNGGSFEKGLIRIVDPSGKEYQIDLSTFSTENLADVKREIEANSPFTLSIDEKNNEIQLLYKDYTTPPGGVFQVLEGTNTAHNLGFGTDQIQNGAMVKGQNDPNMVSVFSRLEDLRGGLGIEAGTIRIFDSRGVEHSISLGQKKRQIQSVSSIEKSPGSISQGDSGTSTLFNLKTSGKFLSSSTLNSGTLSVEVDGKKQSVFYNIMTDTIDSVLARIGGLEGIQGAFYDPDTGRIKIAAVNSDAGSLIKVTDDPASDGNLAEIFHFEKVGNYRSSTDIQTAPGTLTAIDSAGTTLANLKTANAFKETSALSAGDLILNLDGVFNVIPYDPATETLDAVLAKMIPFLGAGGSAAYDPATGLVQINRNPPGGLMEVYDSENNNGNLARHLIFDRQLVGNPENITQYNSAGDIQAIPGSISAALAATFLTTLKTGGAFKNTAPLTAGNLILTIDQGTLSIPYDPGLDTLDAVVNRIVTNSSEISAGVYNPATGQVQLTMADGHNKVVDIVDDPLANGNLAGHLNFQRRATSPESTFIQTVKDLQDQVRFTTSDQHLRLQFVSDLLLPLPGGHLEFSDISQPPGTQAIKVVENTNTARDLGWLTEQIRADSIEQGHRVNNNNDQVDFAEYRFPGIKGPQVLNYEYFDVELNQEIKIYVNGRLLSTEGALTGNDAYSGARSITIPDDYLNDTGVNIIRFDETQPTYNNEVYGVRNVRLESFLKGKDVSTNSVPALRGEFDLKPDLVRETLIRDLNGGKGINLGRIRVRDKAGNFATFDLSQSHTLGEVLDRLNSSTSGIYIEAKINSLKNGLEIVDKNNGAKERLSIVEVDSTTATELGLNAIVFDQNIVGKDLNPIISRETSLSSLRTEMGGIPRGKMYFENGDLNREIDFSDTLTVGQFMDRLNKENSELGLTFYVDPDGRRLNLSSDLGSSYIKARDADGTDMASKLGLAGTQGVFQTLMDFRDSLFRNDGQTISNINLHNIDQDIQRISLVRTDIGARTNRVEKMKNRLETSELAMTKLLSSIEDVDISEAIITLQQIQTNFQASLSSGANIMQISLLNFLS